jgi:hypothetical protein
MLYRDSKPKSKKGLSLKQVLMTSSIVMVGLTLGAKLGKTITARPGSVALPSTPETTVPLSHTTTMTRPLSQMRMTKLD